MSFTDAFENAAPRLIHRIVHAKPSLPQGVIQRRTLGKVIFKILTVFVNNFSLWRMKKYILIISTYRHLFLGRDGKDNLLLIMIKYQNLCHHTPGITIFEPFKSSNHKSKVNLGVSLLSACVTIAGSLHSRGFRLVHLLLWEFDECASSWENISTDVMHILSKHTLF